jgi:two-component system chemotaxis response regulator CheY
VKCLIVDDSVIMRRILVNSLHAIGWTEIVEAADGEQALALCSADIHLVLTDWNMPGMSGVEFIRSLRSNPATASVPVLLVTSRSNKSDVTEAELAGVDGYVMKPFTPDVLKANIETVLSRRERTGTDG